MGIAWVLIHTKNHVFLTPLIRFFPQRTQSLFFRLYFFDSLIYSLKYYSPQHNGQSLTKDLFDESYERPVVFSTLNYNTIKINNIPVEE